MKILPLPFSVYSSGQAEHTHQTRILNIGQSPMMQQVSHKSPGVAASTGTLKISRLSSMPIANPQWHLMLNTPNHKTPNVTCKALQPPEVPTCDYQSSVAPAVTEEYKPTTVLSSRRLGQCLKVNSRDDDNSLGLPESEMQFMQTTMFLPSRLHPMHSSIDRLFKVIVEIRVLNFIRHPVIKQNL